jgi:tRNA dimethylallyltransferase
VTTHAAVPALIGPTASGKTRLALEIAAAAPIEIISVDSAQVYLDMNIGTAKPSAEERARVPHHLIDIVPPTGSYSAARFASDADALISDIRGRGRVPLLVGGTMLYYRALREGLSELPAADADTRSQIDSEARVRGWPALHGELAQVDPETARRLKPTDSQRIQRALEVYRLTGTPLAQLTGEKSAPSLAFITIALVPGDRAALHRRIESRFDAMLSAGLVEEVRELRRRYALNANLASMRAVGYRQAWQFLEGKLSASELRERGVYASRQLAKRQLTWLRSMDGLHVLDCFDPELKPKALELFHRGVEA